MSAWHRLLDAVDRWLARTHGPHDLHGDASVAICRWCRVDWPCRIGGAAWERKWRRDAEDNR